MNSLEYLKQTVESAGATLSVEATCYTATAPAGFCWEPGLHELVASFSRMDMSKKQAREDLILRVQCYTPLSKCSDADCEWCHD